LEHLFCEWTVATAAWTELKRITGLQSDIKKICDFYSLWNNKKRGKLLI
jgi:hypothetical protein